MTPSMASHITQEYTRQRGWGVDLGMDALRGKSGQLGDKNIHLVCRVYRHSQLSVMFVW